ncbi:hypothetical protein ETB97_002108 [Aspergillus alliaceus]|uniref:mRNA stability protein n=2 Tax=Petromyces alliaceus TaxID=209559 RepID=A0A8H6A375_PETAA|nr:hypothetical protein ETB97_002108 [Aspergillus burnettii]
MESENKNSEAEPLSGRNKRLVSDYEQLLPLGGLLESKRRTYFDSGDFALYAANRMSGDGVIQTGTAHPTRESISHPYAPVPSTGNVKTDANKGLHAKSASPQITESSFVPGARIGHASPLKNEVQMED